MKTISKTQAHKVFMYGTHKQLKNSVDKWVKSGIATPTDEFYSVKQSNAKQYKIMVKNGAYVYATGIVVAPDKDGYALLAGSL